MCYTVEGIDPTVPKRENTYTCLHINNVCAFGLSPLCELPWFGMPKL